LFGMMIETLVAALLAVTIGYCYILNKRLTCLRSDEQSLKATISELITATEIAERAIGGLKVTVRECDNDLGPQLAAASELSERLCHQTEGAELVLTRLSRIVMAGRGRGEPAMPDMTPARSLVEAAEAFSDRIRVRSAAA
jgi:hypothetical protein